MRKSVEFEPVSTPLSIGGLAARLGVPRQRIYNMVYAGRIRAVSMGSSLVIPLDEANRIIESAVIVGTKEGRDRIAFNFI
jgi:excisionase family DNA binding protein